MTEQDERSKSHFTVYDNLRKIRIKIPVHAESRQISIDK